MNWSPSTPFRVACLVTLSLGGCVPSTPDGTDTSTSGALSSPNSIVVDGRSLDFEGYYLPRVVQCENGNAPLEALKAQAIASRTWVTNMITLHGRKTFKDSQADQVMSCSSTSNGVKTLVIQAVTETAGQIMTYNGSVTSGQFVSGSTRKPADCAVANTASTEKWVTINAGLTGSDIHPSGWNVTVSDSGSRFADPKVPDNRGAMGQNLADCLARKDTSMTAVQVLKYFYGDDIVVLGSTDTSSPRPPSADDPAGKTSGDTTDPMGNGVVDTSGSSSNLSDTPDIAPDCSVSESYPCASTLLNCTVSAGTCAITPSDRTWRQCTSDGSWSLLTAYNTGPEGTCHGNYDQ